MSALDQPIFIANSNYHVGHEVTFRVAEEQGFFKEEGLTRYLYAAGGLIPGPFEREGLALAAKERGVDIMTAVNVDSVILQRSKGAELFVVGGWRYESTPDLKWYAAKHIKELRQLRGGRIGIRELGGLTHVVMSNALRSVGVDPDSEVEWVCDAAFAYRNNPDHIDMLLSGKVDAMTSALPLSLRLEKEGFPVVLDPKAGSPKGRPGKVIVATARVIEHRSEELSAYLRATLRAYWFQRDVSNFDYLRDLNLRLSQETCNDDERGMAIVTGPEKLDAWPIPIDGAIPHGVLETIIEEIAATGKLSRPIAVKDVLVDRFVNEAYQQLTKRPALQEAWKKAKAAVEKYGF